jgi:hypothetical protein
MPFPVQDVTDWPVMHDEPGGADKKAWIAPPGSEAQEGRSHWWLFKPVKYGKQPGQGGVEPVPYRRSEDRAEKIACELARLIGLPAADVDLARRGRLEGVISRNVAPPGWALHHGDTMLSEFEGYVSCANDPKMRDRPGHNLANIRDLLDGLSGPPGGECQNWPAFDVFAGHLVFDAWTANTDRHALNWAMVTNGSQWRLAKSYDHGSSLASGLTDDGIQHVLKAGVDVWCRRGTAGRFEGGRGLTLVDLAHQGLGLASPRASKWIERLATLEADDCGEILNATPGLSDDAARFAAMMLEENRGRLCRGN